MLGLTLLATATAATVPLRSVLESSPGNLGSIRTSGTFFIVSKAVPQSRALVLGVGSGGAYQNRVSTVRVFAQKEYLTPAERKVFNAAVLNVALKCFNLRAERQAAITAWLDRQNASTFRDVNADFGPMNLQFLRELDDDGTYWTVISMTREGQPGVSPWINYCKP